MRITKKDKKLYCKPQLPASKSLSTRILVLKHIYPDLISYNNLSTADDVQILEKNLRQIRICSASDIPYIIYAKNSGAVARFLTAFAARFSGKTLITGEKRLHQRPVAGLVRSLKQMGADIEYAGKQGSFPLKISGKSLKGGNITVDSSKSSQYVTALLLIANELEDDLKLKFESTTSSEKYIHLSIDMLRKAGINARYSNNIISIKKSKVKPCHYEIENDWASASFWYMMLMLAEEGKVTFRGLQRNSLLPEAILPGLYEQAGISTSFANSETIITPNGMDGKHYSYDFIHNPDLALPFITGMALKGLNAEFTGLDNLKYKESDRLSAMLEIFDLLSVNYQYAEGVLELKTGKPKFRSNLVFDGKNDHRVIMTLVAVALHFNREIRIVNYNGVEKSYPQFWLDISRAGFSIEEAAH